MRAIAVIFRHVNERPRPLTGTELAQRDRARRLRRAATDYEEALVRELAARGRAARLYRTQGPSDQARRAAQDHTRAERHREQAENDLFRLRAHRTMPTT
ncbi:hypothetical protein [Nocardiopsis sp. CNT312]|uniref:hypothetical protein n=1 Tax=Nocardiopsis sp. CNT312 TaxID=1137268 RepID=UPI0012DE9CF9|nr:hypothetical protein [Nocardiopsis sp. CNT312]